MQFSLRACPPTREIAAPGSLSDRIMWWWTNIRTLIDFKPQCHKRDPDIRCPEWPRDKGARGTEVEVISGPNLTVAPSRILHLIDHHR
jgi:hypothetical protein